MRAKPGSGAQGVEEVFGHEDVAHFDGAVEV
jgi:hypothetical protein